MFCPECRREYREGFTECAYCKVPLVETLPEETAESAEDSEQELEEALRQESLNGLLPDDEALSEAGISKEEYLEALKAKLEEERQKPKPKRYRTADERLADLKTSGWTLSGVGVIGLILLILCVTGVIRLNLAGIGAALGYGTMGVLFLIFVISGIRSLAKLPSLEAETLREKEKIREIRDYILENFTGKAIDEETAKINPEGAGDYYVRCAFLKEKITERFLDPDPAFVDYLIEDLYQTLFEEEVTENGSETESGPAEPGAV